MTESDGKAGSKAGSEAGTGAGNRAEGDLAEGDRVEGSAEPATDDHAATDAAESSASAQETAWQRRKRLAAVFGDVLPDATRDERGPDSGKGDDWYRSQVPPHHG